jgi:hypothetical protein
LAPIVWKTMDSLVRRLTAKMSPMTMPDRARFREPWDGAMPAAAPTCSATGITWIPSADRLDLSDRIAWTATKESIVSPAALRLASAAASDGCSLVPRSHSPAGISSTDYDLTFLALRRVGEIRRVRARQTDVAASAAFSVSGGIDWLGEAAAARSSPRARPAKCPSIGRSQLLWRGTLERR